MDDPSLDDQPRLPPGQGTTRALPVVHVGAVPEFDPASWTLRVTGEVERCLSLGWAELCAQPQVERVSDFHCVTGWSRLDNPWRGVLLEHLVGLVGLRPRARFVRFGDGRDYSTNLPLGAALEEEVLLATELDGEALSPEHGGPLRAVVPSRYGWKSCKWLRTIEFSSVERLGFWELRGYHNGADPWREERLV